MIPTPQIPLLTRIFTRALDPHVLDHLGPIAISGPIATGRHHSIKTFLTQLDPLHHHAIAQSQHSDTTTLSPTDPLDLYRTLTHTLDHAPLSLPYRFLILPNLDTASPHHHSALLKIIESPPQHVKVFATLTRPSLPPALNSRFRTITTPPLSPASIADIVTSNRRLHHLTPHLHLFPHARSLAPFILHHRYDLITITRDLFSHPTPALIPSTVQNLLERISQDPDFPVPHMISHILTTAITLHLETLSINIAAASSQHRPALILYRAEFIRAAQLLLIPATQHLHHPHSTLTTTLAHQITLLTLTLATIKSISTPL